jgi:hypothetical protein
MKKIFLIGLATFVIAGPSFAQVHKNSIALGLFLNPYHSEQLYGAGNLVPGVINSSDKGIEIRPSVGWFVNKNFELGISAGFGHQNLKVDMDTTLSGTIKYSGISFSLYGNKYFRVNDITSFYLLSSIAYQQNHSDSFNHYPGQDFSSSDISHGYTIGVAPGISFFPVKRLQLSASVGSLSAGWSITRDKQTDEITDKGWNYGLRVDLSTIVLGISYLL